MKTINKLFLLFLIITLVQISCNDDSMPPCMESCPPPESVGIANSVLMDDPNGVVSEFITFVWDEVTNANSYDLNVYVNNVLVSAQTGIVGNTREVNMGQLALGDEVSAEVRSNCDCSSSDFTERFRASYCNGGSTIEIVPNNYTREQICSIACPLLQFPGQYYSSCGLTVNLCKKNSGYLFYSAENVCDCLNAFPDECTAIMNLKSCLEAADRCIKDEYVPCN